MYNDYFFIKNDKPKKLKLIYKLFVLILDNVLALALKHKAAILKLRDLLWFLEYQTICFFIKHYFVTMNKFQDEVLGQIPLAGNKVKRIPSSDTTKYSFQLVGEI